MRRRWTAVGVCLTFALAVGAAQQPSAPPPDSVPSFRGGIDIVELDVSVLGKDRMPIRGLTPADFTVLEDGKPQPIVAFDAVDLPDVNQDGASWLRDVAPDVATNHRDAQRVVLILVDDCTVSFDDTRLTKGISRAVVDGLGPSDLAAVIYTFARGDGQEFTTDRTLLQASLDRFVSHRPNRQPDGPNAASRSGNASDARLAAYTSGYSGMCSGMPGGTPPVVQALENAAEVLRPWPGARKTLVLVGPFGLSVKALEEPGLLDELKTMFANLQQANINVYQYDPRGLLVGRAPEESFGEFAEGTGGRAITNTNTPWTLVPQMFRENSSYYLLGFRSANSTQDGRFRKLAVNVSRPDVEVRTRSGYFSTAPIRAQKPLKQLPPSALDRAIAGGLPTGDLPMTLTVAPFAVPGKHMAALAIVAGIDATEQTPNSEILEVRASAFQTDWKPAGSETQKVEVQRPAPGASIHADIGSRLDLAPGRYEVRVAIDSPATGRTGSAYTTVIVPDFSKAPLTLSGVVIARGPSSPASGGVLSSLLPLVPTTIRELAKSADAVAFVRIYQGGKAAPLPVQLNARLVNDADRLVFDRPSILSPAAFGVLRSTDYRLDLPLADLEPGRYLLTIKATAGKLSARRNVRLTIRP
jgi:VWFA-related protein